MAENAIPCPNGPGHGAPIWCRAVPSDKRARKRAARDAKMEELARQARRRASIRRAVTIAVIVAVVVGIYLLVSSSKKKSSASSSTTTSTTTVPTTTTTVPSPAQAAVNAVAVAAGCPPSPTTPLQKPTWPHPPAMTVSTSKTYTATVKTDVGTFTVALDVTKAPTTVNNFVFLADQHFFDCMAFMRVVPGFMNQTGSPNQSNGGSGSGPGYTFADENTAPSGGYVAGDLAMANSGPNTNGSQFFVLAGPYKNPGYSLFGHVVTGMDVVQKINADGNPSQSANGVPPVVTHRMLSVTITVA
jgi:cyclophilin family peptidyl-prolyl cis-trans isomerase